MQCSAAGSSPGGVEDTDERGRGAADEAHLLDEDRRRAGVSQRHGSGKPERPVAGTETVSQLAPYLRRNDDDLSRIHRRPANHGRLALWGSRSAELLWRTR